jgi:hypothetical protein
MPAIPTTNNGSTFYNINDCKSFKQTIGTLLVSLTSYPCSEVIIVNKTGGAVSIYDNGYTAANNAFLLGNNESFTFRGVTNSNMISAIAASSGDIYYRTQYFSLLPQR